MEWIKEILKNAGIEETKIDEVVSSINKEMPKHFIPKEKYNELSEVKKKLESDLADRDKQLEDLSKTAGLSEELKKQIEELQKENRAAKEKYEAELKNLAISNAIKRAIAGKVHDEDLVASLFDKEKLVLDGDKVVGLDEQLKELQESKAFLFKQEQPDQPGFKIGASGQSVGSATNEQIAAIFGNLKN